MNPKQQLKRSALLATVVCSLALAGCTHMINPPKAPYTAYAPQEKIPLKVALNVTDELRQAKWERHAMGDTWIIPIGESVAQNAPVLAQHLFAHVETVKNGAPPTSAVDATLTPRVAYVNRTTGSTSFGKSVTTIKIEWRLADATGKTVWADTITGESSGSTGWSNPEDLVKQALEQVLAKSQQGISSAAAVRQFAAHR